jgi:hypothetical protein
MHSFSGKKARGSPFRVSARPAIAGAFADIFLWTIELARRPKAFAALRQFAFKFWL